MSTVQAILYLFSEFFKVPLLGDSAAASALVITDRALKKGKPAVGVGEGGEGVAAAWRDTLVALLLNLFFIFQS